MTAAAISAGVIFVIGVLFALLGAALAYKERRAERRGVRVRGVVVDNVYGAGHASSGQSIDTTVPEAIGFIRPVRRATAHPLVEFTAASGEVVRFRSSHGSSPPSHTIGDEVDVCHAADNPREAEIVGEGRVFTIMVIAFGVVMAGIGAAIWLATRP